MAWTAAPNHWGALFTSKVVAFSTHKTYGLHKPYLKFAALGSNLERKLSSRKPTLLRPSGTGLGLWRWGSGDGASPAYGGAPPFTGPNLAHRAPVFFLLLSFEVFWFLSICHSCRDPWGLSLHYVSYGHTVGTMSVTMHAHVSYHVNYYACICLFG